MGIMKSKISWNSVCSLLNSSQQSQNSSKKLSQASQKPVVPVIDLIQSSPENNMAPQPITQQVKETKQEQKEPIINLHAVSKPENAQEVKNKTKSKNRQKIRLKGPFKLSNFEHQLMQLWEKDPTLTERQFFDLAKKLFAMIEDDKKILININKKWCNRFYRKVFCQQEPSKNTSENVESNEMIPEVGSDMFAEPESAQAQVSVENTSKIWKKHTLKLLGELQSNKVGRKSRQNNEEDDSQNEANEIWVVNPSMSKTLQNRRNQLRRLEDQRNPQFERKSIMETTEGMKKKVGRPSKQALLTNLKK